MWNEWKKSDVLQNEQQPEFNWAEMVQQSVNGLSNIHSQMSVTAKSKEEHDKLQRSINRSLFYC